MRRVLAIIGSVAALTMLSSCWAMPGHDADRSGYNPDEHVITPANVATMTKAWSYGGGGPNSMFSPVVSSAGVHTIAPCGIATLDPATGGDTMGQGAHRRRVFLQRAGGHHQPQRAVRRREHGPGRRQHQLPHPSGPPPCALVLAGWHQRVRCSHRCVRHHLGARRDSRPARQPRRGRHRHDDPVPGGAAGARGPRADGGQRPAARVRRQPRALHARHPHAVPSRRRRRPGLPLRRGREHLWIERWTRLPDLDLHGRRFDLGQPGAGARW